MICAAHGNEALESAGGSQLNEIPHKILKSKIDPIFSEEVPGRIVSLVLAFPVGFWRLFQSQDL